MKTPLAWFNLLHDKTRALVAVAGVAFAVVLVLMQLGFYHSVEHTAAQVYEQLDFDIVIVSKKYLYLSKAGAFPRLKLFQALADNDVASARPLYMGFNLWLNVKHGERSEKPLRRLIFVIGQDLSDEGVFKVDEVRKQLPLLRAPGSVLMDMRSRKQFVDWDRNDWLEIGGSHVEIAGTFKMGTGFGADGDVLVGSQTFRRIFPFRSLDEVSLGLIKLKGDGDDEMVKAKKAVGVAARLKDMLGPRQPSSDDLNLRQLPSDDVDVLTRKEIEDKDREHWVKKTSVGIIFELGVVVGFIVGTAIVYQVLSSDITNHIREYATLKAMGYGRGYLGFVVLQQAWILALVGFLPGWALSWGLYALTSASANITMQLTWPLSLKVWAMTIAMCSLSGLAALRKVTSADPADLF